MATYKPFRELVKAGSNFEFMGRARLWISISVLLLAASIAMLFVNKSMRGDYLNWSTDFKGGTEIIFGFHEKGTDQPAEVGAGDVRKALSASGYGGFEVSDFSWEEETATGSVTATGILVRTRDFGAVTAADQDRISQAFVEEFKASEPLKASWSGDRMHVRTKRALDWKVAQGFLAKFNLDLKPWDKVETESYGVAAEGTGEYEAWLTVGGIGDQYRSALVEKLASPEGAPIDVRVDNVYGVGARAGAKLRNDGIKSLFYASLLIMLYLVVRFDVRYAPGAVAALAHDALITIGVFAATWTEVSLTTVAALLTIIGYSVNDTVVVFDRIRENVGKLKDKKFSRIMNISINETLSRSLFTSVTLLATTLMMNIFGTGLVRNFAFAMNIGVIAGTYSTIFIASPLVLWLHNKYYSGPAPAKGGAVRPLADRAGAAEGGVSED